MKKSIGLVMGIMVLVAVILGMIAVQADTVIIPKGDYTIVNNGAYQLSSDYSGTITVSNAVYEVTVTDSVYKSYHTETAIIIAGERTKALELTIEDLNINAGLPDVYPPSHLSGIDFGEAGNYAHKLYIIGTCNIEGAFYGLAGIHAPDGIQLTIDKAEGLTDEEAVLTAAGGRYGAGIGGSNSESGGTINIVGGTINATSVGFAAGIGGGTLGSGGNINISGGIITASDKGSYGAAIGGGWEGTGGNINISGGRVRAIGTYGGAGIGGGRESYTAKEGDADGGNITISGGEVIATVQGPGAAIGGGHGGSAGNISITGGTVSAKAFSGAGIGNGLEGIGGTISISGGTVNVEAYSSGAGIGGGGSGTAGTVIISGGHVTVEGAIGGNAGIGGGAMEGGGIIFVSGGTVTVTGGEYGASGIGGGQSGDGGEITISGGNVSATGGKFAAGIGSGQSGDGGEITISGGTVSATGGYLASGIGGGSEGDGGNITISGGTINAASVCGGAGIGGGYSGDGGNIAVSNALVTAVSGTEAYDDNQYNGGAGIGGGYYGSGGIIEISGGIVVANGSSSGGAGVGGGYSASGGNITISGGTISATGGRFAAGIGGGWYGGGADVTILNTPSVVATASDDGWQEYPAKPIGNGGGWSELDMGTLRDSVGNNLSYLLFDTSPVADATIRLEGAESLVGEYETDEQGVLRIFIPYRSGDSYSYVLSKSGYEAVGGSGTFSVSQVIKAEMLLDSIKPNISAVTPSAVKEGGNVTVTCADYGIYGTLYLVEKAEEAYASKAELEAAYINKLEAAGSVSIETTGLDEGYYQVYLVDSAENISEPEDIAMDYTVPVVSGKGIALSDITYNSISLVWNEAADNFTDAANLEYIIYKSLANNLDSVESIETNGTVVTNEDITGTTSFTVAGLNDRTTYYLNIIAKDQAGNKACYNSVSARTLKKPSEDSDNKKTAASAQTGTVKTETSIFVIDLMGAAGNTKEIKTELATVTIPYNMLTAEMLDTAQTAELVIGKADTSKLPAELQAQIGSRPVIELALKLDGKTTAWNNPDAPVIVSIPYIPTAEELKNPENITVWYSDGAGNAVAVPNGRYDPATGRVTFTTTHFSSYAVVYVTKSFNDLSGHAWAKKQIEVLAAKGIMTGRTEKGFAPYAGITRAEYIGALVRTLGVAARSDSSFSDVGKGNTYYNEIAIAKKLGITNGIGNNSFSPDDTISRQDMLVLTERALRSLKRINKTGILKDLEQYADRNELAEYAVTSIASLVTEGLIEGSDGRLNAGADTTRAEAAVFLYRIYNK